MYAATLYYPRSPAVFCETNALIKQELMEVSPNIDEPVDMSVSGREGKHRELNDNLHGSLKYSTDSFYGSYMNYYHRLQAHHNSHIVNKNTDHVQISPLENHSSISPVTSPLDMNINNGEGKITVPAVLIKNNLPTAFISGELGPISNHQRAKREFVPDNKKDDSYWCKRLKNNDSARRSRVKRKAMEKMMETKLMELQKENIELKHEVAALRRRYTEEEGSSSDSSSSREKTSSSGSQSPPSSSEETTSSKGDDEQQSLGSDDVRSSDNSLAYTMGSMNSLNQSLGPTSRDRADSVGSSSDSLSSSRISNSSRSESRSSQNGCGDTTLHADMTGAIDLTSDNSNRSMPAWESCASSGYSSTNSNSNRRSSCVSSDSSNNEDTNSRIMVFPFKCRWKKEKMSAPVPHSEKLQ